MRVYETLDVGSIPTEDANFMHDVNDRIRCDCKNSFRVIDSKPYWRLISCTVCKRIWWFTCSGRRLREVRDEKAALEMQQIILEKYTPALIAQLEELRRPKP
jgi:hypothetical protein